MVDAQETRKEMSEMKGESTKNEIKIATAIDTLENYNEILQFTKATPGVFMYIDSVCKEDKSCERYGDTWDSWIKLQESLIGTVFFIVDLDEAPKIREVVGVTETPWFTNNSLGAVAHSGTIEDLGGFVGFKAEIAKTN